MGNKVTLSTRVSVELLERARDTVFLLQGPPVFLTLTEIAEAALRRQVTAVERDRGSIPSRPDGVQAGYQGRRKQEGKKAPKRTVFSTLVDEDLRDKARDAAYLVQDEKESAELFEEALKKELRYLTKRYGPIEKRPTSRKRLRTGRRVD